MRRPLRLPESVSPSGPVVVAAHEHPPLTEAAAEEHIAEVCCTAGPPQRCGVELEWLVHDQFDAARPVTVGPRLAATSSVASGRLTVEPGGQLEYSSMATDDLDGCVEATARDMAQLRSAAAVSGVRLVGLGIDPYREPERMLDLPRYLAMEHGFDRDGPSGRWMMCSTASVQVCVDAGDRGTGPSSVHRRWRLAHILGPILAAAFANSPVARSRPTGWASTRQAVWSRLDRSRTAPVLAGNPVTAPADLAAAWARYALDAKVVCIRREEGQPWTAPPGLTFRSWIRAGGSRPTGEDLDYHLSTLFPPVRPRGYFELRMIDAQRGDGWIVPLAVCSMLLDHPAAGDAAFQAAEKLWSRPGADPWRRAARHALADPDLAEATAGCFAAVLGVLPP
ncbi:MAG: ergothioneine biosynthesis glutamate--cysteine ligase EgtA, partial [Dactylosporangium sp.]|nr:ergothioneine biosynthesis glutamate--cysteine ligase EgtA [Dactylosporangium sp.]NNJ62481.1 ergothioneine biosynthesis glutamate--cysteine ligase EgtA [Dactylosporangium sp.]